MSNLIIAAAAAGVAFLVYEFTKKDAPADPPPDDSSTNNSSTQNNGSTNPPQTPVIEIPKTNGAMRCPSGTNAGLYWVPNAPYPWGGSGPSLLSDQDFASGGKPDEVVTFPNQDKKFYWRQGAEDCTGA